MFGAIGRFLGGLWRFSNFWRIPPFEEPTAGVRVGNPLGGALMFLFLLFVSIAIALVVLGSFFGFSAEQVLGGIDGLLARAGPTLDFVGQIAIRVLLAIILLFCVVLAITAVFELKQRGWGKVVLVLLACLFVGYCSAVNIFAPLERYNPTVGSQYMD